MPHCSNSSPALPHPPPTTTASKCEEQSISRERRLQVAARTTRIIRNYLEKKATTECGLALGGASVGKVWSKRGGDWECQRWVSAETGFVSTGHFQHSIQIEYHTVIILQPILTKIWLPFSLRFSRLRFCPSRHPTPLCFPSRNLTPRSLPRHLTTVYLTLMTLSTSRRLSCWVAMECLSCRKRECRRDTCWLMQSRVRSILAWLWQSSALRYFWYLQLTFSLRHCSSYSLLFSLCLSSKLLHIPCNILLQRAASSQTAADCPISLTDSLILEQCVLSVLVWLVFSSASSCRISFRLDSA